MRLSLASAALALICSAVPATAQTPPSSPKPASTAEPASCEARQAPLGGMGRAMVVAFTGPIFGARVCATVANIAIDGFTAQIGDTPPPGAVVTAALTGGGAVTLPLEGATLTGAGPYVIAPGGTLPAFGSDRSEAPRVVLAYAGQRVLVIATTPVALLDLARALRDHPGVFDADAIERAVVIASGPDAVLSLRTAGGGLGTAAVATPRMLFLIKRG